MISLSCSIVTTNCVILFGSPDAASLLLNATLFTKMQLCGIVLQLSTLPTPTAIPGATISPISATTANLARPVSLPTSRTSGRRLPSSTSSSLYSSSSSTLLVVAHSGTTGRTMVHLGGKEDMLKYSVRFPLEFSAFPASFFSGY